MSAAAGGAAETAPRLADARGEIAQARDWRRARRGLAGLLALSALLRIALVAGGGQGYWPDENRYLRSWSLLLAIAGGDLRAVGEALALSPDHTGFTFFGVFAASVQGTWMALQGEPIRYAAIERTAGAGALVLACASLACIALVFALARRAGGRPREALCAAGLAAAASSLFYYSRHLHPYDLSLALNLLALWLALEPGTRARSGFAVGVVAGAGFSAYNGAWLGSGLAAAVQVLRARTLADALQRGARCALGLASWPLAFSLLTWPLTGEPLVFQTVRFSELARTQADFSEGASLPFAYLWAAERGIALAFAAGAVGAALLARRRGPDSARAALWLGLALAVYAALAFCSVGLERIGVFGRQVRQAVPFLCLATAVAWARLVPAALQRRLGPPLAAALFAQAAWNFAEPLRQVFPADFAREATQRFGRLRRELTLVGPNLRRPAFGGAMPDRPQSWDPGARFALVNAQHLYPVRGAREAPRGSVRMQAAHPMAFRPYQYEGFTPPERAILRGADLSLRVVELAPEPDSGGGR